MMAYDVWCGWIFGLSLHMLPCRPPHPATPIDSFLVQFLHSLTCLHPVDWLAFRYLIDDWLAFRYLIDDWLAFRYLIDDWLVSGVILVVCLIDFCPWFDWLLSFHSYITTSTMLSLESTPEIERGMSAESCAEGIINSIRFYDTDLLIGPLTHRLAVYIRVLCPSLYNYIMSRL